MPRSQASPSSHRKTQFPQTLKKYVGGVPSPVPSDGKELGVSGKVGGPRALHCLPFPSVDVSLSAFYFQDNKKKKVSSNLEKVNVLWVEREACER